MPVTNCSYWWESGTSGTRNYGHPEFWKTIAAQAPMLQKSRRRTRSCHWSITRTKPRCLYPTIESLCPTHAEAVDVDHAVLDGTNSVMLSGESTTIPYPENSVSKYSETRFLFDGQNWQAGVTNAITFLRSHAASEIMLPPESSSASFGFDVQGASNHLPLHSVMPKASNRKKVRQNGLHDGIHIPSYDRWSDPLVLHHKLSGDLPLPFWYVGHDHDENSLQRYRKLWSFGNSHMKAGTDKKTAVRIQGRGKKRILPGLAISQRIIMRLTWVRYLAILDH